MQSLIFLILFLFPFFPSCAAVKKDKQTYPVAAQLTLPGPTIVIDVGHGGTDRGARAKNPFCEEKRVCLQTARLVKKYLDQLGYHVVMTRTTDVFVPLPRRVEIADQSRASLFVSIHYNSARNPTAQGIEVFYNESKDQKFKTSASKKLAESILTRVIRRTSAVSRGVKKGNYYVIREPTMPAVLVEGGFISNPSERGNLKDFEYIDKLARGIADGVDHYFKAKKNP
ncbi:MAG: N-acetylmuramoyl-L-alanine amidase [Verrucomicrobia bacterium]|nr:N-acetylmuramoyl-L-alanine amidase [Verrucomicrobiota bacterium]